jgi:hypothetical protein
MVEPAQIDILLSLLLDVPSKELPLAEGGTPAIDRYLDVVLEPSS